MHRNDFELASLSGPQNSQPLSQLDQLLQSLYGESNLKNEFARTICQFFEHQMFTIDSAVFQAIFKFRGPTDSQERYPDLFSLMIAIAETLKTSLKRGTSLNELAKNLFLEPDGSASNSDVRLHSTAMNAIFTAMGWFSMLYEPSLNPKDASLSMADSVFNQNQASHQLYSLPVTACARRTLPGLLMSFGKKLPRADLEAPSQMIRASSIAYYGLKKFGKIRIVWVNSLTAHLDFDPFTRKLMLFRLPSFCALNCISGESFGFFELLALEDDSSPTSFAAFQALMQEILLSYRVLFGQDTRSRKLFNSTERKRAMEGRSNDRLLDTLCSQKNGKKIHLLPKGVWPEACVDNETGNGTLLEQAVYTTGTDFPILGSRLLALGQFSERQSPSKIRDFWLDRRSPIQWYTFWVVTIIGGISLLLSLGQLLLAVAQVVLAGKAA